MTTISNESTIRLAYNLKHIDICNTKFQYNLPDSQQEKRDMVTFIMSHYKHRVSLQHSVTLSTDTIEGTNW